MAYLEWRPVEIPFISSKKKLCWTYSFIFFLYKTIYKCLTVKCPLLKSILCNYTVEIAFLKKILNIKNEIKYYLTGN